MNIDYVRYLAVVLGICAVLARRQPAVALCYLIAGIALLLISLSAT